MGFSLQKGKGNLANRQKFFENWKAYDSARTNAFSRLSGIAGRASALMTE